MLTLSGAGQPQNGVGIEERFVISVKTDNAGTSADNEFTLPWIGTYDVDWGDGNTDTGVVDTQTHTYASAGTYDVKVTATTGRIAFSWSGDNKKLLNVKNWGTCIWLGLSFNSCTNLIISAIDIPDLSNTTNLGWAFFNCSSLVGTNLQNWDVSNVTYMREIFNHYAGSSLDVDLSGWDFSNVTDFLDAFRNVLNVGDISGWDVSSATNIGGMLRLNSNRMDYSLASWDIEKVTNFTNFMVGTTLSTSNYDETLISWAAQSPQINKSISFGNSQYSYEAAAARQTLIGTYGWTITDGGQAVAPEFALKWETTTPNEEIQIGVGNGTFDYVIDWGDGTVENYTTNDNISHTYVTAGDHITKITGDFPHMNMQNITDDVYREKLRDVLNWGTIVWQDWTSMFRNCAGFTALTATDLPNLSNVTSFVYLGNGSNFGNHYNSSVQNWDVSNVTSMAGFSYYGSWRNKISTWDTSNVTDFANFLRSNGNFDNGGDLADMDNFNVSSAITMSFMFNRTYQMENVYIGSWDVSNVTSMNTIFNPLVMTNSGLENWDISNVSNFSQFNAYAQTNISLANWTPTSMTSGQQFWFSNNAMSVANYDATLISWAGQTLQNNVTFDFGSSQYTMGGAAEAARNTLINTYGWTITDGGGIFVGLLDTYPNASAAYSLRDLASASVGSAVVRVRRSSDNTEQDFTAEEVTDGTLTTFTGANDGFVTTWYDQSGNNVNVVQATATTQPQLVDSGVVCNYIGIPIVKFSETGAFGINKNLKTTSENIIPQPVSYFIAGRLNIKQTQNNLFDSRFNNSNRQTIEETYAGGSINMFSGNYLTLSTDSELGEYQKLYTGLFNTTNSYGYINGEEKVNGDAGNNNMDWGILGSLYRGDQACNNISEFVMYPSDEFSNRVLIEDNINGYYNLYQGTGTPTSGFLFDYPNASAAYSLRALASYDNGFIPVVVRVRRSSDNNVLDFTSAQITDGSLENWVGAGNDGFVVIWYDQSGNENNALQSSTGNQPKIISNGSLILDNGKPSIDYSIGGNDNLGLTRSINDVNSVFIIAHSEISTNNYTQILLGGYSSENYASGDFIIGTSYSAPFVRDGNNYLNGNLTDFTTNTRPIDQTLYSMIHTSANGHVGQLTQDRGRGGRSWQGKMQEIILYPTDQSANRTGIETNINTEYTIY